MCHPPHTRPLTTHIGFIDRNVFILGGVFVCSGMGRTAMGFTLVLSKNGDTTRFLRSVRSVRMVVAMVDTLGVGDGGGGSGPPPPAICSS